MLSELLDQLSVAWQPIMDLRAGTPWGYEALIQGPAGSAYETPEALGELALRAGAERELEAARRRLAFDAAAKDLPRSATLCLRVDPSFTDLGLIPPDVDWPADHTVIGIAEDSPLFARPEELQSRLSDWRALGCRIAFVGFGSGFAGPAALLATRPDIVKIDRLLVRELDRDPWRKELISAIVRAAADVGTVVVAEGINEVAQLNEIVACEIRFGQGTLLGRLAVGAELRDAAGGWQRSRRAPIDILASELPTEGAAYVVDRTRTIVAWNEDAVSLSGYRPEAVVGTKCWLSGLDHSDVSGARLCFRACPLVKAMQTGEPQQGLVSLRTAGGARKWVISSARPIKNESGEVVGAVEMLVRTAKPQPEPIATPAEAHAGRPVRRSL